MPRLSNRPGFAIPTALLVSLVLLVLLTAAFTLVSAERKVSDDGRAAADAEAEAESGLETYLVSRATYGFTGVPAASESVHVVLGHGYADVVLNQIRPVVGNLPALFLIKSHGVRTVKTVANSVNAERTVAEYALWKSGTINATAAFTSLTGISKNGGSGTLSGVDACGGPSVAGVSVPTPPGYSQNGGGSVPTGSPNILSLGTQAQAAAATKIDWAGISAGTALTPDVSLPGGAWPSFANPSSYPVIYASGDLSLPGSGQGILIVTGNLTINGALQWNGIILVGGSITSNGNNTVNGAVMTGLNVLLGQTPGVEAVGNGNKTFRYNSCEVAKAMASFGGLVPYSNAWVDDWATF